MGVSAKANTKLLGFKFKGYDWSARLRRDVERLMNNAVREWLRAMLVGVPVWSGMALGSIKFAQGTHGSLAAYLGIAMPISPVGPQTGTFISPTSGKKVHLDKDKTPEAGGLLGKYRLSYTKRNTFAFEFSSDVPHFVYNNFFERTDYGAANQQIEAPWQALKAANAAWLAYVRTTIKAGRFSKVHTYISREDQGHNIEMEY